MSATKVQSELVDDVIQHKMQHVKYNIQATDFRHFGELIFIAQ
jgi:hypothetical protein